MNSLEILAGIFITSFIAGAGLFFGAIFAAWVLKIGR